MKMTVLIRVKIIYFFYSLSQLALRCSKKQTSVGDSMRVLRMKGGADCGARSDYI